MPIPCILELRPTSQQGKRGMGRNVSTISGMVTADMMTPMNMAKIPVTQQSKFYKGNCRAMIGCIVVIGQ